ncbi:MAG: hypothetical protein ACE5K1_12075 [Acidiferrobacterales bacterium]
MAVLKQVLPKEFLQGKYNNTPAYQLRDARVVAKKFATGAPCSNPSKEDLFEAWPGPHGHVHHWFILENGKAVGFNEDPQHGWSFPVVDYPTS